MKKLLATTALVSVMAAPVLAETKIAGSLETTFSDKETPTTGAQSSKGAALGHETKFEFVSTKELNNGWSSTLDMEVMEVAGDVADTEVTISNGEGLNLYISKDGGSFHDWTVVPGAYNARPADNAGNDSAAMDAGKQTSDPVLSNFKGKFAVDWSPFLKKSISNITGRSPNIVSNPSKISWWRMMSLMMMCT